MRSSRWLIGAIALSLTLTGAVWAAGVDVNADSDGLALRGYDPVAYFTADAPTKGKDEITVVHEGATYRFASEENRAAFQQNPGAYVPAYGGFCAFGTAMGYKVDGDPAVWRIVGDVLYLNYSEGVKKRWEGDIPGFIGSADAKWTEIADKAPEELR
ncbi:YHS domain-containing (seleno)protein [Cribrihabitans sp. XS_ASV171]